MKKFFLVCVLAIVFVISVIEFSQASIYGNWVDDEYYPAVKGILTKGEISGSIIYTGGNTDEPYIGINTETVLTEYYIEGIGSVTRWSEIHSYIDHWIDSVKLDQKQKLLKKYK